MEQSPLGVEDSQDGGPTEEQSQSQKRGGEGKDNVVSPPQPQPGPCPETECSDRGVPGAKGAGEESSGLDSASCALGTQAPTHNFDDPQAAPQMGREGRGRNVSANWRSSCASTLVISSHPPASSIESLPLFR